MKTACTSRKLDPRPDEDQLEARKTTRFRYLSLSLSLVVVSHGLEAIERAPCKIEKGRWDEENRRRSESVGEGRAETREKRERESRLAIARRPSFPSVGTARELGERRERERERKGKKRKPNENYELPQLLYYYFLNPVSRFFRVEIACFSSGRFLRQRGQRRSLNSEF